MTNANVGIVLGRDSSSLIFEGRTIAHGSRAGHLYTYLSISNRVDGEKRKVEVTHPAPHISTPVAETCGAEVVAEEMKELDESMETLSDIADVLPATSSQRE
jgi:hypothetical protein